MMYQTTKGMIKKRKLPMHFNIGRLQADLRQFAPEDWVEHFNKSYYEGDWSAVPLRSVNGDPKRIFSDPSGLSSYHDTPHRNKTPYLDSVINSLECEKEDVRLMRLRAGSSIRRHRDYGLRFEEGYVRLHIPVITDASIEFYLDDERVIMREGECWYLNFDIPHRVENRGLIDRVHLVIDCKKNAWLENILYSV